MKKLFIPFVAVFVLSCQKQWHDVLQAEETQIAVPVEGEQEEGTPGSLTESLYCVTPVTTPLMAGQSISTGDITVTNDETNVYVTYQTSGNYLVKKTHLFVGACSAIPVNNSGNPRIGQFPYQTNHGTGVSTFTYTIPRSSLPAGCLCVSAHAEVVAYNAAGTIVFSQTGWGLGVQINDGGSWAMRFDYCQQDCDDGGGPR